MSQQVVMCDQNPEKQAVYSYRWEWGDSGVCSAEARPLLEQTAGNLNRRIDFAALVNLGEPPLERTERARLKGDVYALEEECAELKGRAVTLYNELTALRADNRLMVVRDKEAGRQLEELKSQVSNLKITERELNRELDSANEELTLIRGLISEQTESDSQRYILDLTRALEASKASVLELQRDLDSANVELNLARETIGLHTPQG